MKKKIYINLIISIIIYAIYLYLQNKYLKNTLSQISIHISQNFQNLPNFFKSYFSIFFHLSNYLIITISIFLLFFFKNREKDFYLFFFLGVENLWGKFLRIYFGEILPCLEDQKISEFFCFCDFGNPSGFVSQAFFFFFFCLF